MVDDALVKMRADHEKGLVPAPDAVLTIRVSESLSQRRCWLSSKSANSARLGSPRAMPDGFFTVRKAIKTVPREPPPRRSVCKDCKEPTYTSLRHQCRICQQIGFFPFKKPEECAVHLDEGRFT